MLIKEWPAERDLLLRRRERAVTQMLYHVSLANQEQLAFSFWSRKWKASVSGDKARCFRLFYHYVKKKKEKKKETINCILPRQ